MAYEWDSELESGHPVIDEQHKALFAAVNAFSVACRSGKGKDEIDRTLNFLVEYSIQHFHDEEELQKKHNFPDLARHRQYHNAFKKTVGVLLERYRQEGPTDAVLNAIYNTVGDWLLHHIKGDDFVLAAYLRDHE